MVQPSISDAASSTDATSPGECDENAATADAFGVTVPPEGGGDEPNATDDENAATADAIGVTVPPEGGGSETNATVGERASSIFAALLATINARLIHLWSQNGYM